MSSLILNSESSAIASALPWPAGRYCEDFERMVIANEEFVKTWQVWLKSLIEANVPIENIIKHRFCPTENTPPGEWLKNTDNFNLIRRFMFLDGSGPESCAAKTYGNLSGGPFDGVFKKNDISLEEAVIMKYIYGRYHFALLNTAIDRDQEDFDFTLKVELGALQIYYDMYGNENDEGIEEYFEGTIDITP